MRGDMLGAVRGGSSTATTARHRKQTDVADGAADLFGALLAGQLTPEPVETKLPSSPTLDGPSLEDETDVEAAFAFSSNALPGDPRGVFVDGHGGYGHQGSPGPTVREPGSSARGLRLDSAQPGGAGAEHVRFRSRRTLPGSRGFPPELVPEGARAAEAAAGAPDGEPLDFEALKASVEGEFSPDDVLQATPPAPTATRAEGSRPNLDGSESGAEPVDLDAADASESDPARSDSERSRDEARSDDARPELRLDGKRARASTSHAIRSVLDALTAEAPEAIDPRESIEPGEVDADPAEVVEDPLLPPARPDDAPTRITLADDLTLEVDLHDGMVEVTLEGDTDAVEPLSDLGRELDEELRRHGWSLGTFAERRQQGDARSPLYRSRRALRAVDGERDSTTTTSTRRIRRGHVVDVLA